MNINDKIKRAAAMKAYDFADKDPVNNIPRLLEKLAASASGDAAAKLREAGAQFVVPGSALRELTLGVWRDVDEGERRRLAENAAGWALCGVQTQKKAGEKYGCVIPQAIALDSSVSGCELELLDSVVSRGEELGCSAYILAGSEPLARRKDVALLCSRHRDSIFVAFTGGAPINEAFAEAMLSTGNLVPLVDISGFEKGADSKALEAMELLSRKKLLFGVFCRYDGENAVTVCSGEYFDAIIKLGAKLACYLPASPDERFVSVDRRIREERRRKPLAAIDFSRDGEFERMTGGGGVLVVDAAGNAEGIPGANVKDAGLAAALGNAEVRRKMSRGNIAGRIPLR